MYEKAPRRSHLDPGNTSTAQFWFFGYCYCLYLAETLIVAAAPQCGLQGTQERKDFISRACSRPYLGVDVLRDVGRQVTVPFVAYRPCNGGQVSRFAEREAYNVVDLAGMYPVGVWRECLAWQRDFLARL